MDTVRHTLAYLGPRVQATRMVRDYVTGYYGPASVLPRAVTSDLTVAKGLAAWKDQVRAAWPNVRVINVDTSGIGTEPSLGNVMTVRAYLDLGGLAPRGRRGADRHRSGRHQRAAARHHHRAHGPSTATRADGFRYEAHLPLTRSGAVGYTVRVLPRTHPAGLARRTGPGHHRLKTPRRRVRLGSVAGKRCHSGQRRWCSRGFHPHQPRSESTAG